MPSLRTAAPDCSFHQALAGIDEPPTHLACVVDNADAIAPNLIQECRRVEARRQRETRAADERAAGRDQRARWVMQRQAAVTVSLVNVAAAAAPSAENAQRRP
jgi:hypothetical protein